MTEQLNIKTIKGEVWKSIDQYPKYLVSNYGRVYSFYRKKILKPTKVGKLKMYVEVILTKDKVRHHVRLNRLVAMVFLSNPENKPQVHHIDGNSLNNAAANLMWVTLAEHTQIHREMRGANNNA